MSVPNTSFHKEKQDFSTPSASPSPVREPPLASIPSLPPLHGHLPERNAETLRHPRTEEPHFPLWHELSLLSFLHASAGGGGDVSFPPSPWPHGWHSSRPTRPEETGTRKIDIDRPFPADCPLWGPTVRNASLSTSPPPFSISPFPSPPRSPHPEEEEEEEAKKKNETEEGVHRAPWLAIGNVVECADENLPPSSPVSNPSSPVGYPNDPSHLLLLHPHHRTTKEASEPGVWCETRLDGGESRSIRSPSTAPVDAVGTMEHEEGRAELSKKEAERKRREGNDSRPSSPSYSTTPTPSPLPPSWATRKKEDGEPHTDARHQQWVESGEASLFLERRSESSECFSSPAPRAAILLPPSPEAIPTAPDCSTSRSPAPSFSGSSQDVPPLSFSSPAPPPPPPDPPFSAALSSSTTTTTAPNTTTTTRVLPWMYHLVLAWKQAALRHPNGLGLGCVVFAPKRLIPPPRSPPSPHRSSRGLHPTPPPSSSSSSLRAASWKPRYHYSVAEITGVQHEDATVTVTFLCSPSGVEDETVSVWDVIPMDAAVWREVQETVEEEEQDLDEEERRRGANSTARSSTTPFASTSSFDSRTLAERLLHLPQAAGPLPEEALRRYLQRGPESTSPDEGGKGRPPWMSNPPLSTTARSSSVSSEWSHAFPSSFLLTLPHLYHVEGPQGKRMEWRTPSTALGPPRDLDHASSAPMPDHRQQQQQQKKKRNEKDGDDQEEEGKKKNRRRSMGEGNETDAERAKEENGRRAWHFPIPVGPTASPYWKNASYLHAFRVVDAHLSDFASSTHRFPPPLSAASHADAGDERTPRKTSLCHHCGREDSTALPSSPLIISTLCVFDSVSLLERFDDFMSFRGHVLMPWLDAFPSCSIHEVKKEEEEDHDRRGGIPTQHEEEKKASSVQAHCGEECSRPTQAFESRKHIPFTAGKRPRPTAERLSDASSVALNAPPPSAHAPLPSFARSQHEKAEGPAAPGKHPSLPTPHAFHMDGKIWYCLLREEVEHTTRSSTLEADDFPLPFLSPSAAFSSRLASSPPIDVVLFFSERHQKAMAIDASCSLSSLPFSAEAMLHSLFSRCATVVPPFWTLLFEDDPPMLCDSNERERGDATQKTSDTLPVHGFSPQVVKVSGAIYDGRKILVPPSPEQLLLLASTPLPFSSSSASSSSCCGGEGENAPMGEEEKKKKQTKKHPGTSVKERGADRVPASGSTDGLSWNPVVVERIALGSFTDASLHHLFSTAGSLIANVDLEKQHRNVPISPHGMPDGRGGPVVPSSGVYRLSSVERLQYCCGPGASSSFGDAFPVYAAIRHIVEDALASSLLAPLPSSSSPFPFSLDGPSRWRFPRIAVVLAERRVAEGSPFSNATFVENVKRYFTPWVVHTLTSIAPKRSTSAPRSEDGGKPVVPPCVSSACSSTVQWDRHGGLLLLFSDEVESLHSSMHTEADIVIACGKRASAWVAAERKHQLPEANGSGSSPAAPHQRCRRPPPYYYAVISEIEVAPQPSMHFWIPFSPSSTARWDHHHHADPIQHRGVGQESRLPSANPYWTAYLPVVTETEALWDRLVTYVKKQVKPTCLPKVIHQAVELWVYLQEEERRRSAGASTTPIHHARFAALAKSMALCCASAPVLRLSAIHFERR